jgi:glycogen synthase
MDSAIESVSKSTNATKEETEIDEIVVRSHKMERAFDSLLAKVIAFVTYESPWFPCGGVQAVMGRLPCAVEVAARLPTVVFTPFHRRSTRIDGLPLKQVHKVNIAYGQSTIAVAVLSYDAGCPWYFLKADEASPKGEQPFFDGVNHPYDLPRAILVRDALFFGAAVVHALAVLDRNADWKIMMQDWEAATTALAFASQSAVRGKLYLTLHNSYDEYAPPDTVTEREDTLKRPGLFRVGIRSEQCPGDTILDRALALVEQPIFTVSEQFALEFTEDLLQCDVMAHHLQKALHEKPILGVDNGPFKNLIVPRNLLHQASRGEFGPLHEWKMEQRAAALQALAKPLPSEVTLWGDSQRFRNENATWIVMAGRDDPRQKGYDVAAAAVEDYLKRFHAKPDCAQFFFFPILGDEGQGGLDFLETLASEFPEDVLVFLGRWEAGYSVALRGAAYGLMPSLYEPFGMGNEFYLDGGCVGIGRAPGGNLEQLVPLRAAAAFSQAVRVRANRHHALSAPPTGILFRERDDIPTATKDWKAINDAAYQGKSQTRVAERQQYPVFQAMADELRIAIEDGMRVYTQEPELYYSMLAAGVAHIQQTFSWQRAAQEYVRYLS